MSNPSSSTAAAGFGSTASGMFSTPSSAQAQRPPSGGIRPPDDAPDAHDALDPEDQAELPFTSPLPWSERPFLDDDENPFAFDHVNLRFRHDGWTPERQERFIEALASTGCVEHAARAVGKTVSSAYALKTRAEARSFRLAWDAAVEVGIKRLSEAALSRAIHGTVQPIYYKGEQVGERRHYDERLTMFLLRYRDPARFGHWIDKADSFEEKFDGAPMLLRQLLNRMIDRLFGEMGEDAFDRAAKTGKMPEDWDGEEEEEEEDLDEDEEVEEEEASEEASPSDVIPAQAGIQPESAPMESRLRGNGEGGGERDGTNSNPDPEAPYRRWRPPEPRVRTF